jgi:hypothetical protein
MSIPISAVSGDSCIADRRRTERPHGSPDPHALDSDGCEPGRRVLGLINGSPAIKHPLGRGAVARPEGNASSIAALDALERSAGLDRSRMRRSHRTRRSRGLDCTRPCSPIPGMVRRAALPAQEITGGDVAPDTRIGVRAGGPAATDGIRKVKTVRSLLGAIPKYRRRPEPFPSCASAAIAISNGGRNLR